MRTPRFRQTWTAIRALLILTVVLGIGYPAVILGIGQFARSLEAELLGSASGAGTATTTAPTAEAAVAAAQPGADSVDLLKVVALPVAKRAAPVLAGVAAGAALGFLLGKRRKPAHPAAIKADELIAALSRLVS